MSKHKGKIVSPKSAGFTAYFFAMLATPHKMTRDVITNANHTLVCLQNKLPSSIFVGKHWHQCHTNGKKFYQR